MLCSALLAGWSAVGVTSGAERVALVGAMSAASVPVAPSRPWAMLCSAPAGPAPAPAASGTGGADGGASPDALAAPLARATGVGAGGAPGVPAGVVEAGGVDPSDSAPPRSWVARDDVAPSASATLWVAGSAGSAGGSAKGSGGGIAAGSAPVPAGPAGCGSAVPGCPDAGWPSDDSMPCSAPDGNGLGPAGGELPARPAGPAPPVALLLNALASAASPPPSAHPITAPNAENEPPMRAWRITTSAPADFLHSHQPWKKPSSEHGSPLAVAHSSQPPSSA